VRYASGRRNLPVRASHELWSREHCEEDLKARCVKGTARFGRRHLTNRPLALDEDQQRGLIQEHITCRVDEFDALAPQGVGEGGRHVIRYEEWATCAHPKLVDDRAERRRAQAASDLGNVAELATAKLEANQRLCAVAEARCSPPQDPEPQAERLHGLERVGKQIPLGFLGLVHLG
jgi:hypothetical protein